MDITETDVDITLVIINFRCFPVKIFAKFDVIKVTFESEPSRVFNKLLHVLLIEM